MYGAKKSNGFPKGFISSTQKVESIQNLKGSKVGIKRDLNPDKKLIIFSNISSIVLTIISMLSIIFAMNIQDADRNNQENWNPTVVYIILLLILGTFLGFAFNSLRKKSFKLLASLSFLPVIAVIITSVECSVLSDGFYNGYSYENYINNDSLAVFNAAWIVCTISVLIIMLIPVFVLLINKINDSWHRSMSYREKCYDRVEKMHNHLEKGIITEEEYEEARKHIVSKIL